MRYREAQGPWVVRLQDVLPDAMEASKLTVDGFAGVPMANTLMTAKPLYGRRLMTAFIFYCATTAASGIASDEG